MHVRASLYIKIVCEYVDIRGCYMRISSIQPSMYKSAARMQHVNSVSYKGGKGAAKGAVIGGVGMGLLAFAGIASLPAALILGGITAGLSAIIGSEFEDNNQNDNKGKGDT